MDARDGIRTVVRAGSSCASACAMALFVSGVTRIVYMGGRLGIHSCYMPDGTPFAECSKAMAANATAHGVPWGVIDGFGKYTKPSNMMWLGAEDAECGLSPSLHPAMGESRLNMSRWGSVKQRGGARSPRHSAASGPVAAQERCDWRIRLG
jgi:hypothetical protein